MYDLVVVGGGTAGCAAAYIAGKLGQKVLLIEKNIHLGGTITSGLVVPVMLSGDNQINTEFYNDLITELKNIGGQITYQKNSGWFNPELVKIALDSLLEKSNVEVRFSTKVCKIDHKNSSIQTLWINKNILLEYNEKIQNMNKTLLEPIETRYVLDSTGNSEIFKKLNCKFLKNEKEFQPISLRFTMSGIDSFEFTSWLETFDTDRDVTTVEVIDGYRYCSTAYTWDKDKKWALEPLFRDALSKGFLKDTDCNYFQIFSVAGAPDSIAFNCPRIVGNYDQNDTKDISKALIEARKAILRLADFCKIYFPGFKNAYISNIADSIGIRVSDRIKGKYIYTEEDLKTGKKFNNPVLISNYPIDVHSKDKDCSTLQKTGEYQLPIEALMSVDYDLFAAGRNISADFKAQAALRVQSSCFSMGEAVARYVAEH